MSILIYAGIAGDRNDRGMAGAVVLGTAIADAVGVPAERVGQPAPPVAGGWAHQLAVATPALRALATALASHAERDDPVVMTMGRCTASLATLPVIARRHPDAALVWFDAHGDINIPAGRGPDVYLGGMVITGAAGEWDTGLGAGLDLGRVILVGARDLDPPEEARIAAGEVRLVPGGPDLAVRLTEAIGGRPVHVHLDCDVLDAGLVATEYQCAGGLSLADLAEAFAALARHTVVGLEIAEFEALWPDGRPCPTGDLVAALRPVLARIAVPA